MAIDEGFTQKEMLVRILNKIDSMETKVDKKLGTLHEKINQTNSLATKTNGKVLLHTKSIYALAGAVTTLAGWLIYHLIISIK